MSGQEPLSDIDIEATLAAHGFLLERAFSLICQIDPTGKEVAFQKIEAFLLGITKRSVANPYPMSAGDVKISDAAEQELMGFLPRLRARLG